MTSKVFNIQNYVKNFTWNIYEPLPSDSICLIIKFSNVAVLALYRSPSYKITDKITDFLDNLDSTTFFLFHFRTKWIGDDINISS